MSDLWVLNASPLIVFGKIGRLDLLAQLSKDFVVPRAVADEIKAGPENDTARLAIEAESFRLVETQDPTPELAAWDLGLGETAVLSYALETLLGQLFLMTARLENVRLLLLLR